MLLSEHLWRFGSFELDRYFEHPERPWPTGPSKTRLSYHVYRHDGHVSGTGN